MAVQLAFRRSRRALRLALDGLSAPPLQIPNLERRLRRRLRGTASFQHPWRRSRGSRAVHRDMSQVTTPALVLHAMDDDIASPRSAEFVARNMGSSQVRTILHLGSYHILTIDSIGESVADETIGFFRDPLGGRSARSDEFGEGVQPEPLAVA